MQIPGTPNVYRLEGFLSPETCGRVRRAMDRGVPDDAEVLGDDIAPEHSVRRAASVEVDAAVLDEVGQRLDAQRDSIAAWLGTPLGDREGAGFVRYPDGGFYRPHRDRADVPSWPGAARRMVAVVVFLNDGFGGGVLRLFGDDD